MKANLNFGEKLKNYRKDIGLSQERLAELIEAESADTISRYELGKNFPGYDKLKKLVKVLGVSFDDLLDEESDIKAKEPTEIKAVNIELTDCSEKQLKTILAIIKAYKKADNK